MLAAFRTRGQATPSLLLLLMAAYTLLFHAATAADGATAPAPTSDGLSSTAVAIIIVGVVVVLALLAILVWFLRRKNKHKDMRRPSTASPLQDDNAPTAAFFLTAFSPPASAQSKSSDYYSGSGMNIDGRANRAAQISAPVQAPYSTYCNQSRQSSEPVLYNREATTTLRVNDSTRSYLYEPTASPGPNAVDTTPKIFSSKNSVDFNYPDTDRSIDAMDSNRSDLFGLGEVDDSNRSNDSSVFGFIVDSNNSARTFGDDDSARSSRAFEDESNRSIPLDHDLDTNTLNTEELRRIKVEL